MEESPSDSDDFDEMEIDDDKEEILSWKRLDDGQLEITTNKRTLLFDQRAADYVESKNKLRNLKVHAHGYICSGYTPLHRIVGDQFCKTDDEVKAQYPDHFKANPHDTIVVMHLDNDKLNFNINNLERGPQMLNKYMQMRQPRPCSGDNFQGLISVGKKEEHTKSVSTVDEAKHAMDILKIQKLPHEFREFIFKHSMHKPLAFAEHYASVKTLLERAPVYAKKVQKQQKPRVSKNIYEAFRTLEEARKALADDQMKIITAILETPGVAEFDPALDCIVRYTGSLKKVQHVLVLEYACYVQHMEKTRPAMNKSGEYLLIKLADGLNYIHNVVLGRPIGQKARDGLEGGHGWGKTLDNRKRTLGAQTKSVNNSERGQSGDKSVPGVVGVYRLKNGTFRAQIGSFFERADTVHLGTYATTEEASDVYQFAVANKTQLVEACKDLENRVAELRARCVAKRV